MEGIYLKISILQIKIMVLMNQEGNCEMISDDMNLHQVKQVSVSNH